MPILICRNLRTNNYVYACKKFNFRKNDLYLLSLSATINQLL